MGFVFGGKFSYCRAVNDLRKEKGSTYGGTPW
jgi:hypothetical protein